jgi:hypothetical protein
VVHLRLDQDKTVDVLVQGRQTELEDIKLIIEHERIYEHYSIKEAFSLLAQNEQIVVQLVSLPLEWNNRGS